MICRDTMSSLTYASCHGAVPRIQSVRQVFDRSFPDPFVWQADGCWFAIATGRADDGRVFPMLVSTDFEKWVPLPGAMRPVDGAGADYWAPEVAFIQGAWTLFYSVGAGDAGHQLRMARASSPSGPYYDSGRPILDPMSCGFAIDAHPYCDPSGQWWLFYARDFLDERVGTGIVVAPLNKDLTVPAEFNLVVRATADWQIYERGRTMYGRTHDWHTLEGPSVVTQSSDLYLFYSGGNWQNGSYGVDWVTSTSPLGPWKSDNLEEPRLLKTGGDLMGPGHNSFVLGADGQLWSAFHAWNSHGLDRVMWLGEVVWGDLAAQSPHSCEPDH